MLLRKLSPAVIQNLKIVFVLAAFAIAIFCFMIKLPKSLRKIDSELHTLFFFSAAAFLNIIFLVKKLTIHFLIFGMLFTFSVLTEFAQEYSNSFVARKIHGNFDPSDLKYNLFGLCCFTILWLIFKGFRKLTTF